MLAETFMLLIAVQGLEAADDANLALTTCGFAAFRSANERDQTAGQFDRTLSSQCAEQIARMQREMIAIGIRRGKSAATASAAADDLIAEFRAWFADQYAKRAQSEAQMRALGRALREEGKANAQ